MTHTTNIGLRYATPPPRHDVLDCSAGAFISIKLGDDVSVILPGTSSEQVAYARALAATASEAANELERRLAASSADTKEPSFDAPPPQPPVCK